MKSESRGTLDGAFCDVLEKMVFVSGEPVEEDVMPEFKGKALKGTMEFEGPLSGTMTLAAPLGLCSEMAANMLGEARLPGEAFSGGYVLEEILNVTCGNLLALLAGEEATFNLSVPRVEDIEAASWQEIRREKDTAFFRVEGRPVLLRLSLRGTGA